MGTLEALIPPVIVCTAFVAILVAVKRWSERESAHDKSDTGE